MPKVIKHEPPMKPLCLENEEAKKEIFDAINGVLDKKTVPLFLVENILREALERISAGAKQERERASAYYKKQLAEYEKQETEE